MTLLGLALILAGAMLTLAVALTGWRMLRGPGIADRAVAMDLLGLLAVGAAALVALGGGHLALLDVALGLGLVGFIGAVGVAAFIARAAQPPEARDAPPPEARK
jgi:multisubunit Na+/H+ antiporter MnhF subunit